MDRLKKQKYIRLLYQFSIQGMMLCVLSVAQASPSKNGNLVNNWDVEGAHGVLYVRGVLTESACRLDMDSAWQDIDMHKIGTGQLRTIGAAGEPIGFELRLADCVDLGVGLSDVRTGGRVKSIGQPAVRVSFNSERDINFPQWVKVHGISGVGLRLLDERGQDVRLGERGLPLQLSEGNNILRYSVTPMRTTAPLKAGAYHAVVDFHLNYD